MIAGNAQSVLPAGLTVNSQIDYLESESPEDCARECIESKLSFLLGVQGYSLTVPGIPREASLDGFEVLTIFGTTDNLVSEELERLNDLACKFANKFNTLMFASRIREKAGVAK